MLIVAGCIEGFVARSTIPYWVQLTVAAITGIGLIAYFGWAGRGDLPKRHSDRDVVEFLGLTDDTKPQLSPAELASRYSHILDTAIAQTRAMPDDQLASAAGGRPEHVPALRGARTLVEAREIVRQIDAPAPVSLGDGARPAIERFLELRAGAGEPLDEAAARTTLRELKAVGGDLKAVRLVLTGRERGPELAAVIAALPRDELLRRASL